MEKRMYEAITRDVRVSVVPRFMSEESAPREGRFFWAYTIEIENRSTSTIKLLTRHWVITNSVGEVQEVRGEGVVGNQPVIGPGERFSYTSGCPLTTPDGTMRGSYGMVDDNETPFEVEIPLFALDSPHARKTLH
jgi:ApaG protein